MAMCVSWCVKLNNKETGVYLTLLQGFQYTKYKIQHTITPRVLNIGSPNLSNMCTLLGPIAIVKCVHENAIVIYPQLPKRPKSGSQVFPKILFQSLFFFPFFKVCSFLHLELVTYLYSTP